MPQLFFLRHAESEANAKQEYASQLPIPISKIGHEEAARTAQMLKKNYEIDTIYSSTLQRALQTASYFVDVFGVPLDSSDLIIEQDLGLFTGQHYDVANSSPQFENDVNKRWDWIPPGDGESYAMIADRVLEFLKEISKLPDKQNILIVTHGVTLRLIKGALENNLPNYNTELTRNCEIIRTEFRGLGQAHEYESIYYLDPCSAAHGE